MGHATLRGGSIRFGDTEIARLPPYRRVRLGIGLVPQEREIFGSLTVEENLSVAARKGKWSVPRVYDFFPSLAARRTNRGNQLSGGEQQMLAIGRALMSQPKFLMLDEPSLGLAPLLVKTIFEKIVEINRERGLTILLVEQNANRALEISHSGYVLETGRITVQGISSSLRENPQVRSAYLGGS
jgi:branched-chain amino acid transport system ATP-binding protein